MKSEEESSTSCSFSFIDPPKRSNQPLSVDALKPKKLPLPTRKSKYVHSDNTIICAVCDAAMDYKWIRFIPQNEPFKSLFIKDLLLVDEKKEALLEKCKESKVVAVCVKHSNPAKRHIQLRMDNLNFSTGKDSSGNGVGRLVLDKSVVRNPTDNRWIGERVLLTILPAYFRQSGAQTLETNILESIKRPEYSHLSGFKETVRIILMDYIQNNQRFDIPALSHNLNVDDLFALLATAMEATAASDNRNTHKIFFDAYKYYQGQLLLIPLHSTICPYLFNPDGFIRDIGRGNYLSFLHYDDVSGYPIMAINSASRLNDDETFEALPSSKGFIFRPPFARCVSDDPDLIIINEKDVAAAWVVEKGLNQKAKQPIKQQPPVKVPQTQLLTKPFNVNPRYRAFANGMAKKVVDPVAAKKMRAEISAKFLEEVKQEAEEEEEDIKPTKEELMIPSTSADSKPPVLVPQIPLPVKRVHVSRKGGVEPPPAKPVFKKSDSKDDSVDIESTVAKKPKIEETDDVKLEALRNPTVFQKHLQFQHSMLGDQKLSNTCASIHIKRQLATGERLRLVENPPTLLSIKYTKTDIEPSQVDQYLIRNIDSEYSYLEDNKKQNLFLAVNTLLYEPKMNVEDIAKSYSIDSDKVIELCEKTKNYFEESRPKCVFAKRSYDPPHIYQRLPTEENWNELWEIIEMEYMKIPTVQPCASGEYREQNAMMEVVLYGTPMDASYAKYCLKDQWKFQEVHSRLFRNKSGRQDMLDVIKKRGYLMSARGGVVYDEFIERDTSSLLAERRKSQVLTFADSLRMIKEMLIDPKQETRMQLMEFRGDGDRLVERIDTVLMYMGVPFWLKNLVIAGSWEYFMEGVSAKEICEKKVIVQVTFNVLTTLIRTFIDFDNIKIVDGLYITKYFHPKPGYRVITEASFSLKRLMKLKEFWRRLPIPDEIPCVPAIVREKRIRNLPMTTPPHEGQVEIEAAVVPKKEVDLETPIEEAVEVKQEPVEETNVEEDGIPALELMRHIISTD